MKTDFENKPYPTSAVRTYFNDGMIVTADDLTTAVDYPLALMQTVNRAVYGCGVICGFEFKHEPEGAGKDGCDWRYVLEVSPGVALDCYGLPIELCHKALVPISPDICKGDNARKVCILARRATASEGPRHDCRTHAVQKVDCSRRRDQVVLKAFPDNDLPAHTCKRTVDTGENEDYACECNCCGEGWVLLGCVEFDSDQKIKTNLAPSPVPDEEELENWAYHKRRWIKPVAQRHEQDIFNKRIEKLLDSHIASRSETPKASKSGSQTRRKG